jgi:hypothetical protein
MIGKLLGSGFDGGDPDDEVRCKSREWLTRGMFPGTADGEIPVYHEHARCPDGRREERVRNVERATAREYAVPCPACVIGAGVAADDDLGTPRDVAEAMDEPPDLVVETIEVTD